MYIVRYTDDFKIFTDSHPNAIRVFHRVQGCLKDNLNLEIASEKSKVTNLRKRKTEFLGFDLKANKKRKSFVAHTCVSTSRKNKSKHFIRNLIKNIQKTSTIKSLNKYDYYVLGVHNYYKIATHVHSDFSEIAYSCSRSLTKRLRSCGKYGLPRSQPDVYKKLYKGNYRTFTIRGKLLFPTANIRWYKASIPPLLSEITQWKVCFNDTNY